MKVCSTCEREYKPSSRHKDCPKCRAEKRKTPCVECGALCRYASERCVRCAGLAQKGKANPNWQGGKYYNKKGYIMIRCPWHPRGSAQSGYVFEHILVMEDILGRYLVEGENVHHKNGVKDDNRPENLELWTRPQPVGIRAEDAVVWAQEVLGLYAPELLNGCNTNSSEDGTRTGESVPPISTRDLLH